MKLTYGLTGADWVGRVITRRRRRRSRAARRCGPGARALRRDAPHATRTTPSDGDPPTRTATIRHGRCPGGRDRPGPGSRRTGRPDRRTRRCAAGPRLTRRYHDAALCGRNVGRSTRVARRNLQGLRHSRRLSRRDRRGARASDRQLVRALHRRAASRRRPRHAAVVGAARGGVHRGRARSRAPTSPTSAWRRPTSSTSRRVASTRRRDAHREPQPRAVQRHQAVPRGRGARRRADRSAADQGDGRRRASRRAARSRARSSTSTCSRRSATTCARSSTRRR